jgi:hypothetical protein
MLLPLAATTPPPAEPPGVFARASAQEPLERRTFLVPGLTFVGWQPVRPDDPARGSSMGAGLELSLVHWITGGTYIGAAVHAERLERPRASVGLEVGYQLLGLEVGVARELDVEGGPRAQWSLEVGPYASIGMLYVMPRWIVALDRRARRDTPGDGAMLVVGLKLPLEL